MLRQGITALKTFHGLGYAHGDLKPENVCARETKENQIKFMLIDFGISQRLAMPGETMKNKYFRGNFMFCSDRQLNALKPTQFCDLLALLHIAYYVVFKDVPSTEYA
jgi:serine/threonine protein kinase